MFFAVIRGCTHISLVRFNLKLTAAQTSLCFFWEFRTSEAIVVHFHPKPWEVSQFSLMFLQKERQHKYQKQIVKFPYFKLFTRLPSRFIYVNQKFVTDVWHTEAFTLCVRLERLSNKPNLAITMSSAVKSVIDDTQAGKPIVPQNRDKKIHEKPLLIGKTSSTMTRTFRLNAWSRERNNRISPSKAVS